jgi:hypothetical protein
LAPIFWQESSQQTAFPQQIWPWLGRHAQTPAWQTFPPPHVPHDPPHPSSPQDFPPHAVVQGLQAAWEHPYGQSLSFVPGLPHESNSQIAFPQQAWAWSARHVHEPAWQTFPPVHVPHEPPHPSSPHILPPQAGVQSLHLPALQPNAQSSSLSPWTSQESTQQTAFPQHWVWSWGVHTHFPALSHVCPVLQAPQVPPHPSGPQSLPAQAGGQARHLPSAHPYGHSVAFAPGTPHESTQHSAAPQHSW